MNKKNSEYIPKLSNERLSEIKREIEGDIRIYLKKCSENYLEYVAAAQKLFPEIYKKIEKFDYEFDFQEYLSKLDKAKKAKDIEVEFKLLKSGLENKIYTPGTYDRLAVLYERNKQLEKARKVCLTWFENDFWKLPNTSKGSLRILDRLEKLEKKYSAQQRL